MRPGCPDVEVGACTGVRQLYLQLLFPGPAEGSRRPHGAFPFEDRDVACQVCHGSGSCDFSSSIGDRG